MQAAHVSTPAIPPTSKANCHRLCLEGSAQVSQPSSSSSFQQPAADVPAEQGRNVINTQQGMLATSSGLQQAQSHGSGALIPAKTVCSPSVLQPLTQNEPMQASWTKVMWA